MCAGADWDGAFQLRKTSLLEVEARCSRDEACEGYYAWNKPPNYTDVGDMVRPVTRWGTTGAGFRFKSGKVYGWGRYLEGEYEPGVSLPQLYPSLQL